MRHEPNLNSRCVPIAGHIGHIELPLPVCNPLFYGIILQLLKLSCIHCHRFRVRELYKELFLVRQRLLKEGLIIAAEEVRVSSVDEQERYTTLVASPCRPRTCAGTRRR